MAMDHADYTRRKAASRAAEVESYLSAADLTLDPREVARRAYYAGMLTPLYHDRVPTPTAHQSAIPHSQDL